LEILLQNDLELVRENITGNIIIDVICKTKAVITFDGTVIRDFCVLITNTSAAFSKCVEKETGTYFVDGRINKILERFIREEKKKKGLYRKRNTPINEQYDNGLSQDEKDEAGNNGDY
jgi:hypothetical protein